MVKSKFVAKKVRRHSSESGFTLLFASLIASIVLALGISIFEIAQKQLALSAISRESEFAFYAADTAAECALYWDFNSTFFATTSAATASCDGTDITTLVSGRSSVLPYTLQYQFDLFTDSIDSRAGRCAKVSVDKKLTIDGIETIVHADGYNVSCAALSTARGALERSVEYNY